MHFSYHTTPQATSRWAKAALVALVLHVAVALVLFFLWDPDRGQSSQTELQALWEDDAALQESLRHPPPVTIEVPPAPPGEVPVEAPQRSPQVQIPPAAFVPPSISGLPSIAVPSESSQPRQRGNQAPKPVGNGAIGDGGGNGTGGPGDGAGSDDSTWQGAEAPQPPVEAARPSSPPPSLVAQGVGYFQASELTWSLSSDALKTIVRRLHSARRKLVVKTGALARGKVEVRFRLSPLGQPLEASVDTAGGTSAASAHPEVGGDAGSASAPADPLKTMAIRLLESAAPYPTPTGSAHVKVAASWAVGAASGTQPAKSLLVQGTGDSQCDSFLTPPPAPPETPDNLSAHTKAEPSGGTGDEDGGWQLLVWRAEATVFLEAVDGQFSWRIGEFVGDQALRACIELAATRLAAATPHSGFLRLPVSLEEK